MTEISIAPLAAKEAVLDSLLVDQQRHAGQAQRLQEFILKNIPLAESMQLTVTKLDEQGGLHLRAPLDSNNNDKQNGFGGSISSLLMLSGWGWLQLANETIGFSRNIVIHKAQMSFDLPVTHDLVAVCPAPLQSNWHRYCSTYYKRQRARLPLQPLLLLPDGKIAARMQAEYVATQVE